MPFFLSRYLVIVESVAWHSINLCSLFPAKYLYNGQMVVYFSYLKESQGKKPAHNFWIVVCFGVGSCHGSGHRPYRFSPFFYTVSIGNAHISRELNVESMHSRPVAGKPRNSKRYMSLLNIYFVLILFVSYREAIG